MKLLFLPSVVVLFLLFSLSQRPTLAIKQSYIVYLGEHSHGARLASDSASSESQIDFVVDSHYEFLGSYLDSKVQAQEAIFYSYSKNINGFAAVLEEEQAAKIAKDPKVVSIFLNKERKLHTTHSWEFLGLEKDGVTNQESIWKKARFGEDVIIGNLDTGVWPESKSFSDEGYGPVPSKWRGVCQADVRCNRKLIGARYFNKGYEIVSGSLDPSLNTPRDDNGHGTHTLSTAAGSFVPNANYYGFGNGTAKGGSPKARVAAYKVCWPGGCFDADIMAAIDAAISDGVDVLSMSLGGPPDDYFSDAFSIGTFHAVKKGIAVVCSAGNEGPVQGRVSNASPWVMTVAASTTDREFTSYVTLGNKNSIKGTSLSNKTPPSNKLYPLISAGDAKATDALEENAMLCKNKTLDAKKVNGKILVCVVGEVGFVEKGQNAALAGAVGMILVNDMERGNHTWADPHVLPATHISYSDGESVLDYIKSTQTPLASISPTKTELGVKPAPFMAQFSSRGPNKITPGILKPDIAAPGVNIIAAFTQANKPDPFVTESGTSMSCPHVSGVVGLLKSLYPKWSSAAIKSAIMTTARTGDLDNKPMLDSFMMEATPFSYGAGHIRPNQAMDPGLVYDLTINDYLDFLCAIGYNQSQVQVFSDKPYTCPTAAVGVQDLNYPSITVPDLVDTVTVVRKVKNVGPPGVYRLRVKEPAGISVSIQPDVLSFQKTGEEKKFEVVLKGSGAGSSSSYVFGELIWSDSKHHVRSPIVVKYE